MQIPGLTAATLTALLTLAGCSTDPAPDSSAGHASAAAVGTTRRLPRS